MKRIRVLLVLGLLCGTATSARTQEPPYREFVNGLRERHLSDLAVDYLKELSQKKLPPEVAAFLPLEMARTRLALAEDLGDAGQRAELYARAQEDFNAFLKGNPKPEVAAEVNLDLARLLHLQARLQLSLALQQDTPEEQFKQKLQVRGQFEAAARGLDQAAKQLGQLLANYQSPRTPAEETLRHDLTQAMLQTELEQGQNYLEELKTFDEQTEGATKRYPVVQKAMDVLAKVAGADTKDPLSWQGRAWLGRCYQESDTPGKARAEYDKVIDAPTAAADAGRRVARYFQITLMEKDPEAKGDPVARVQRAAENWLETYRADQNTPEGYGVRFLLADAYHREALQLPKAQQSGAKAQELYAKAEKLFDALERTPNDFSQRARDRKLNIILSRSSERSKNDINKLANFQECYVRAQLEIAEMGDEDKKFAKAGQAEAVKYEEGRKRHLQNMIAALSRGLDLADDKTPASDRNEARYILAYAYFAAGQPYEAAVVAEDLARTDPKSSRAAAAAGYALEAYSQIVGQDESKGATKAVEGDRDRLRKLAAFMEKTWPNDPATDLGRHQLGALALRDKNYPEAITILSGIKPSYSGYSFSEYQLATAALAAGKENLRPLAGQPSYKELALAALQKVPDLSAKADSATAQIYFYAKLELANLLFRNKQYKEMQDLTEQIRKRFESASLEKAVHDELEPTIASLPLYAQLGEANLAFRAGRYADVRNLTDPFVNQLKDGKLANLKDTQLIQGMLGLALRANVREGDTKRARDILDLLQQKAASGLQGGATDILVELVQQLRGQVEELRKKGKPAEAELEKTVSTFSAFLDELAKQPAQSQSPELVRFLAFSYGGLDKHDKAVALLENIKKPEPSRNPDKEAQEKENQEKEQFYHSTRLLLAHELRLAKQLDKAAQVLKEVLATDLGKRSLDATKERIFLLEDQKSYAAAAREWNSVMSALRDKLNDPKMKEQYFECYFHFMTCYYNNALLMKDEAKKQQNIKRAAGFIVNLENKLPDMGGFKARYDELLAKEVPLKQAYDDQKKAPK